MEELLNNLKKRGGQNWLIGYDSQELYELTSKRFYQFQELSLRQTSPQILVAESEPLNFLSVFLAAVAANCPIFLGNPTWKQQEWQQVFDLVKPDLVFGIEYPENFLDSSIDNLSLPLFPLNRGGFTSQNLIMIPTGGSSGTIRFAIHTWQTLTASVKGFYQYFGGKSVNCFCILPLYHVSGLMQFMRSFLTGGDLAILPYKALKTNIIHDLDHNFDTREHLLEEDSFQTRGLSFLGIKVSNFFISLVPTQLQFLLECNPHWLSQFKAVLLGGAPAWQSLLEEARKYEIPLAPTYGMTETASQIVTLKPADFLKDNCSTGQVLPHAQVTICNEKMELLGVNQTGIITIKSDSLCLGYYPQLFTNFQAFQTDDLGYFDRKGYLYIVGRNSQKIISGGENIFPAEVEAAILATKLVRDVAVIGLPDEKWGQVVMAAYIPKSANISLESIKLSLTDRISKFKQPKYWLQLESFPRNQQGKINYQKLQEILENLVI